MNFFTQKKAEDIVANAYIKFNEKTITALTTIKNNLIAIMAKQNTKNPQRFRQTYQKNITAAQQNLPADINNKLNPQLTAFYADLGNADTYATAQEEYENLLLTIQNRIIKLQKNYDDYINQKESQKSFSERANPLLWGRKTMAYSGIGTALLLGALYSGLIKSILQIPTTIITAVDVVKTVTESGVVPVIATKEFKQFVRNPDLPPAFATINEQIVPFLKNTNLSPALGGISKAINWRYGPPPSQTKAPKN
jgi:hypothetical protein